MALFKTQSVDALDKTRGSPGYRRSASVIVAPSSGGLSLAATGGPAPRAKIPSWYRNLHQTLLGDDERSASLDDLDDDSIQDRSTAAAAATRSATGKLRSESVDLGSYSRSMTALSARGRPTPLSEINEEFKGLLSTTAATATSSKSTRHVTGVAERGSTRQQQSQQHQPRLIDIDHRPANDAPVRSQEPSPPRLSPAAAATTTTTTTVSHREVATETATDDVENDVIDAEMADTDDEALIVDQSDELSEAETQRVNNIQRRTTVCDKVIQVDEDLDSPSPLSLPPLPRSPPPPLPLSFPPAEPHRQPSDVDVNTADRQVELIDTPLLIGRDIATETPMAKAVMAEASTTTGSQQQDNSSAAVEAPAVDHNVDHPSTGPTTRTRSSVMSTSPLTFSTSGSDDVPSNRKQLEKKKFVPRFSTGGDADFTSVVGVNGASGGMSRQSSVQSSNKVDWRRREAVTSAPLGLQTQISLGSTTDRQQQQQQQQRHGNASRDLTKTTPTDDRKFRPEKPPNGRTKQLIADDDEGKFLRCRSLETIPSETAERRLMDIEIPCKGDDIGSSGAVAQTSREKLGGRPRSSSDGLDSRTSRGLTLAASNGSSSSRGSASNHSRQKATELDKTSSRSGVRYAKEPTVVTQPPPTDHVTNGRPARRPVTDVPEVDVNATSTTPKGLTNGGRVRGSDDVTPSINGRQSTTTSSFDVKSSQKSSVPQEATVNKKQYKWTVHESTPLGRPRTAAAIKPSSATTTSSSSIRPAAASRPPQATMRTDIGSASHSVAAGPSRKDELRHDAKLILSHQNDVTYTSESTRKQPETSQLTFSAYNGRHDEAARPTNGASVQQSAAAAEPGRQQNLVAASTGRMQSALAKFRSMESLVASAPTPVPISMSTAGTTAAHRAEQIARNADRGSRNTGTGTGKPNATGYGTNRGLDGSGTVRSAAATTMTKFRSMENIDGGTTFGISGSPTHVENLELYQIDAGKMTGHGSEQIRQKEVRQDNRTPTVATQRRQETSTQLFKYRSLEDVLTPTSALTTASERLRVANGDCQTSGKAGTSLTMPVKRAAEASMKVENKPETKYAAAEETLEVAKQPEIRSAAPEINREIPAGNPVTKGEKTSSNDKDTSDSGTTDNSATAQHLEHGVPSRYSFIPKYQSMEDIVTDLPRIGRPQRWQKAAPSGGQQSSSAASRRSFSVDDVSGGRQQQDEAAVNGRGFRRSALSSVDGGGSNYSSSADCNGDGAAAGVIATVAPWNDDQSQAERAAANRDVVKSCLFIKLQTTEDRSDEVAAAAAAAAAAATPAPTRIRIVSVRRQN